MKSSDFNNLIDTWIKDLEQSTLSDICAKPLPDSWSLGQVCMHLIEATNFYLEQIKICLITDDHSNGEMTSEAKTMFQANDFPDEIIEGPPSNANTPQPKSKEALIRQLIKLKADLSNYKSLISSSQSKGKTKHPGLNYLSASEWYQFAEMHFRHHMRQKKRIEAYLN